MLIVLHAASCVGLNGLESLVQQVRERNGHRHMAKKFKGTRNCPPDCTPSQLLDAQVLLWLSVRPAQTAHSLEHLESVLHIAIQSVAHSVHAVGHGRPRVTHMQTQDPVWCLLPAGRALAAGKDLNSKRA